MKSESEPAAATLRGVGIFQPQFVEFGGEERVILSLSRELHRQGREHFVMCYQDHIGLATHADWPLKVYELSPCGTGIARLLALRRAVRLLHQTGQPVPVLFNIQAAYHAGLVVGAPYHLRIPDTFSLLAYVPETAKEPVALRASLKTVVSGFVAHAATRRGIRNAQALVTNTRALRDEMNSLYGRAAEVIYLGGFGDPIERASKPPVPPVELLSVSRLQTSKRIDWMLRSLAALDGKTVPAWRLHVAGTGPESDALRNLAIDLGISDRVVFHGFVSDEKLAALYANSHVFLMPAKQGFGLPAIEAVYQRMVVVVSEESGVIELLADTPWAVIAQAGEEGFARALAAYLQQRVATHDFSSPLPQLPTEAAWAQQVIRYCNW